MYCATEVDEMFDSWRKQGLSKEELIVKCGEAELGWPYVWGAVGAECTPEKRKAYAERSVCPAGEVTQIYKTCQYYTDKGEKSGKGCGGCVYYPNNQRTLCDDCQGFVKQICSRVGITVTGGGATSMWNGSGNWSEKGTRDTLPEKLCCIFWQASDKKTMSHIGFYIGDGWMIHCSGTVKKERISSRVTHWAIPRGLGGDTPMPTHTTLRKGATGPEVVECQEDLLKLGYDLSPYGVDGKYGNTTMREIRKFQSANGLTSDGICGPRTWEALDKAVGPTPTPTPTVDKYTVTIPHLTLEQANALIAQYPGASKVKE